MKTKNLGSTTPRFLRPLDLVVSALALGLLGWVGWGFVQWAVFGADWTAASAADARGEGAIWSFVIRKLGFFVFGFYPREAWWRIVLLLLIYAGGALPLLLPRFRWKMAWFAGLLVVLPLASAWFISGGPGLRVMSATDLGGLSLTLVISILGILLSFPLGVILALGRRSTLPVIRGLSITYIEFFRGVPLIAILFMASVAVPFFLPEGVSIGKLTRVLAGFILFQSAYLAEVVRGGLQAIPKGQFEAADSLGFSWGLKHYLVILPQALRATVSNMGGISISFVKDTSLVLIIGMFDLLGIVRPLTSDPAWLSLEPEGLLFAGLVYWFLCFGVSKITKDLEDKVNRLPATAVTQGPGAAINNKGV